MNDEDFATDAMPSPPRDFKKENSYQETTDDKGYSETEQTKNNENSQSSYKRPSNLTMINVSHSQHVHVGSNTTIVFNKKEAKKKYQINENIKVLMGKTNPLTKDHIAFLSSHIGEGWKNAARALNYSEGQIDQFFIDNCTLGLREVIYQFLLDWTRNETDKATVGRLANVLWAADERDAVNRWALEI